MGVEDGGQGFDPKAESETNSGLAILQHQLEDGQKWLEEYPQLVVELKKGPNYARQPEVLDDYIIKAKLQVEERVRTIEKMIGLLYPDDTK